MVNINIASRGRRPGGKPDVGEDPIIGIGESTEEGRAASHGPSVTAGHAYEFTDVNTKINLADPVGGANIGSIWPAFANAYYDASGGRVPVILECGRGGAVLTSTANSDSGYNYTTAGFSLYNTSLTRTDTALAALGVPNPRAIVCAIGLNDAFYMDANPGTYTKAIVKAAFYDLIDRYKTKYPSTPFYIIKCGRLSGVMTTGCVTVNEIFDEAAADYPHVYVCKGDVSTFTTGNGKLNGDGTHWSTTGNLETGTDSGNFVVSNPSIN